MKRAFRRGDRDVRDQVDEEVLFHLERKIEKLRAAGLSEEEARAEARRRFGDVEAVKSAMTRESERREGRMRTAERVDRLRQDLVYALRQLKRSPAFTAVTVLTLTLGIGATTAIFSVVDGILLRPLPFERPEQLVAVWSDWTGRGGPVDEWPNFPNLWELRERSRSLQGLGIWNSSDRTLTGQGDAQQVPGVAVSHDMLAGVLRVEPELGRGFAPEEDRPDGERVVLLSRGFFDRVLGGDAGVIGTSLTFNGIPHTVLGVMPADFRPPFRPDAEVLFPLRMDGATFQCGRGGACLRAYARLADGTSLQSARAEAAEIARRQREEWPDANAGVDWALTPLRDDIVAPARNGLLILFGASVLVLLIACVNQANLLLARGSSRRAELGVRAALGAGRGRIVEQLLTESLVLAGVGGVVGIGAAYLLTEVLVTLAPPGTPRIAEVAVDGRVLAFAALVSLASGALFGILPAFRGARGAPQTALREGGRGGGGGRSARTRSALVAAQVALALVLLVGSGLLIRSFGNLRAVELGFRPDGVLLFGVGLPGARYPNAEAVRQFVPALEERLAAIPGVEAVGASSSPPLVGLNNDTEFLIEGRPVPAPDVSQATWYRQVTPTFFGAMGIQVVSGRGIEPGDVPGAPAVGVINEAFARQHFPDQDPIGARINFGSPEAPEWVGIVGVARDVKHFGLREPDRTAMYVPAAQVGASRMYYAVRSRLDPEALVPEVRRALADLDPQLAVSDVAPLGEVVGRALGSERFLTMLLSLFAGVALALAVVGLYGVVSYDVNSRLREMGVRLALGASGGGVAALVLRRSLTVVALGLAVGGAGALALARLMETLLFGVSPADPATYLSVALLLAAAATVAALLPARRAARLDPVRALRSD